MDSLQGTGNPSLVGWALAKITRSCAGVPDQPDPSTSPEDPPAGFSGIPFAEEILSRIIPGGFDLTPPLVSLLIANFLTIVIAIAGNWDAATALFVFWTQSVIIGIFTVAAILFADTMAIKEDIDARHRERGDCGPVDPRGVRTHQRMLAGMFAVHYGIFHIAYYVLIFGDAIFGPVDVHDPALWFSCGVFFVAHFFSFLYYRTRERRGEDFVNDSFIGPYFRIVPMHLIIFLGAGLILLLQAVGVQSALPVLVVFLVLKTGADLAMHIWKHTE